MRKRLGSLPFCVIGAGDVDAVSSVLFWGFLICLFYIADINDVFVSLGSSQKEFPLIKFF